MILVTSFDSINNTRSDNNKFLFYNINSANNNVLEGIFKKSKIDTVIHFPDIYSNDINSTLVLLKLMKKYNVKNLLFNSFGPSNLIIENILKNMCKSDSSFNVEILRPLSQFNEINSNMSVNDYIDMINKNRNLTVVSNNIEDRSKDTYSIYDSLRTIDNINSFKKQVKINSVDAALCYSKSKRAYRKFYNSYNHVLEIYA